MKEHDFVHNKMLVYSVTIILRNPTMEYCLILNYSSQMSMDKGFFQPALHAIGFNPQFQKTSSGELTFVFAQPLKVKIPMSFSF